MNNQTQRIVILGAASAIAEAAARIWAAEQARFVLVGRDAARLDAIAADLKARDAQDALAWPLDCASADAATELGKMVETLGGLDILLLAYGDLGDQAELERSPTAVAKLIQTNFTSAVGWCLAATAVLEKQRKGALLVIGSVAGDRGRRSNFVYGATKGGLARLVEGIAHKLAPLGARAVLIKPGFVDTPMTASFTKKGLLWSKPEQIAPLIAAAAKSGGPVVYAPHSWRLIMLIIRHLPTFIFNKLNI
jgi:NAD(P)-dependent dehydrogenase (short-subunit alcohol dehydrogenase family)